MVRRLQLPSQPLSAAHAVRFAEEVGREAGLPTEAVDRLVLAAGEAVTNAIRHGNRLDPVRQVELVWRSDENGDWLEVSDEGPGIALDRILRAELPADASETSGRGLFLIRVLSDAVDVEGARLRMRFEPRPDGLA